MKQPLKRKSSHSFSNAVRKRQSRNVKSTHLFDLPMDVLENVFFHCRNLDALSKTCWTFHWMTQNVTFRYRWLMARYDAKDGNDLLDKRGLYFNTICTSVLLEKMLVTLGLRPQNKKEYCNHLLESFRASILELSLNIGIIDQQLVLKTLITSSREILVTMRPNQGFMRTRGQDSNSMLIVKCRGQLFWTGELLERLGKGNNPAQLDLTLTATCIYLLRGNPHVKHLPLTLVIQYLKQQYHPILGGLIVQWKWDNLLERIVESIPRENVHELLLRALTQLNLRAVRILLKHHPFPTGHHLLLITAQAALHNEKQHSIGLRALHLLLRHNAHRLEPVSDTLLYLIQNASNKFLQDFLNRAELNLGHVPEMMTFLQFAVRSQYLDKLKTLIQFGADPNHDEGDLLALAIVFSSDEIVHCLLQHGVSPNGMNGGLLALCAQRQKDNIAKLLLDNGADPLARQGLFLELLLRERNFQLFIYALQKVELVWPANLKEGIEMESSIVVRILRSTVIHGNVQCISSALQRTHCNEPLEAEKYLLSVALRFLNKEMVALLLSRGTTLEWKHFASLLIGSEMTETHYDILEALIQHKQKIGHESSLMSMVIQSKDERVVTMFLKNGYYPVILNGDELTPAQVPLMILFGEEFTNREYVEKVIQLMVEYVPRSLFQRAFCQNEILVTRALLNGFHSIIFDLYSTQILLDLKPLYQATLQNSDYLAFEWFVEQQKKWMNDRIPLLQHDLHQLFLRVTDSNLDSKLKDSSVKMMKCIFRHFGQMPMVANARETILKSLVQRRQSTEGNELLLELGAQANKNSN